MFGVIFDDKKLNFGKIWQKFYLAKNVDQTVQQHSLYK